MLVVVCLSNNPAHAHALARAEFQKRNLRQEGGACQAPPCQRRGVDNRDRVCTENRFRFKGKVDGRGRKKSGARTCVVQNRKVMRCPRFAWVFVLSFSFMLGLRVSVKKTSEVLIQDVVQFN